MTLISLLLFDVLVAVAVAVAVVVSKAPMSPGTRPAPNSLANLRPVPIYFVIYLGI